MTFGSSGICRWTLGCIALLSACGEDDGGPKDGCTPPCAEDETCTEEGICRSELDADLVSREVPEAVLPLESFRLNFTVRNTGLVSWSRDAEGGGFWLGLEPAEAQETWGRDRIEIEAGVTLDTGALHTFATTLLAPETPGPYEMTWQMTREGVGAFGETVGPLVVEVEEVGPGPSDPVELGSMVDAGSHPVVAAMSWDRVAVLWEVLDGPVRWACFDGESWTSPVPVDPGATTEEHPTVAVDSDGSFHAAWSSGTGSAREIHYAYFAGPCGAAWSLPEVVSGDDPFSCCGSVTPSIGVDQNAIPHVTWSQATVENTDEYCDAGTPCADDYECDLAGSVCLPAVWEQHSSRRLDGTWEEPMTIESDRDGRCERGRIQVVASNDAHVVYRCANGESAIHHARFDGDAWASPTSTGVDAFVADVRSDGETVHVFTNTARHASLPLAGGEWTVEDVGAGGDETFGALRLGPEDGLHAVWTWGDDEDGHRMWYSERPMGGVWRAPLLVTPDQPWFTHPSMDVDGDGWVHLVWAECQMDACPPDGEHGAIWHVRTTYDDLDAR